MSRPAGHSNRDLRGTWKRMGDKETQKTDSKADKFYFSHTGYILVGAGRGWRGVALSLGNAPIPRNRILTG